MRVRFPGLPRLPVSRRRHEEVSGLRTALAGARGGQAGASQRAAIYQRHRDAARSERDAALHRVVELEQAIRAHHAALNGVGDLPPAGWTIHINAANRRLWRVLDGHDRQKRGDGPGECTCERLIRESFGAHWESCPSLGGRR